MSLFDKVAHAIAAYRKRAAERDRSPEEIRVQIEAKRRDSFVCEIPYGEAVIWPDACCSCNGKPTTQTRIQAILERDVAASTAASVTWKVPICESCYAKRMPMLGSRGLPQPSTTPIDVDYEVGSSVVTLLFVNHDYARRFAELNRIRV